MPTQSIDIIDTNSTALTFGPGPNSAWIIAAGVTVASTVDSAIFSSQGGSVLLNNGNIFSGASAGVSFGADGVTITNTGNIVGLGSGIFFSGNGATILNSGAVSSEGTNGIEISGLSQNVVLSNTGAIFGHLAGILDLSDFDGATISNSGSIGSDGIGVLVNGNNGLITVINNAVGGTIAGDSLAISSIVGRVSLDNRGTVSGNIDLDAVNQMDTIVNRGKIDGQTFLGSGDDAFTGVGSATFGKVFGEAGVDQLKGSSTANQLDGGSGNDVLTGGRGNDILTGGLDADRFDFNSVNETAVGSKRDILLDFTRSQGDKIDLSTIDAKTGVSGNNAFTFIGAQDFHDKKGELHFVKKAGYVLVEGDRNGDRAADFQIKVNGAVNAIADDFLL